MGLGLAAPGVLTVNGRVGLSAVMPLDIAVVEPSRFRRPSTIDHRSITTHGHGASDPLATTRWEDASTLLLLHRRRAPLAPGASQSRALATAALRLSTRHPLTLSHALSTPPASHSPPTDGHDMGHHTAWAPDAASDRDCYIDLMQSSIQTLLLLSSVHSHCVDLRLSFFHSIVLFFRYSCLQVIRFLDTSSSSISFYNQSFLTLFFHTLAVYQT